jgi:hypothetical protein
MQIIATKVTAALTGAWTVMGMSTYVMWAEHQAPGATTNTVGFFLAALVFLLAPCILFVAGPQWFKFGLRDTFSAEYWKAFRQLGIRGLCWFFGGSAFGAVYLPLLERLYTN